MQLWKLFGESVQGNMGMYTDLPRQKAEEKPVVADSTGL
jgi:hypothetical protein